jgi:hypothetical protein
LDGRIKVKEAILSQPRFIILGELFGIIDGMSSSNEDSDETNP